MSDSISNKAMLYANCGRTIRQAVAGQDYLGEGRSLLSETVMIVTQALGSGHDQGHISAETAGLNQALRRVAGEAKPIDLRAMAQKISAVETGGDFFRRCAGTAKAEELKAILDSAPDVPPMQGTRSIPERNAKPGDKPASPYQYVIRSADMIESPDWYGLGLTPTICTHTNLQTMQCRLATIAWGWPGHARP